MYNVMGTGPRSMVLHNDRLEIYEMLEYKVKLICEEHPDLVLISGLAEGWDEAIAKVGMRNGIPYHVYIPNTTYGEYYWGRTSLTGKNRMNVFTELVFSAEYVKYVCGNNVRFKGVHANFIRNQAMVDVSDFALVYTGEKYSPGTQHALSLLKEERVSYSIYPFETNVIAA